MGATLEKWRQVKKTFTEAGLQKTLLEVLLWQAPVQAKQNILVNGQAVTVNVLAELPGAAFIEIPSPDRDAASWHKAVDKELAKRFPERIDRFTNPNGDSWYWPKKLASGSISYDRLPTKSGELPDYLAQRLAGLSFTQREHTSREISPLMVKERIRGQFESSKITSDFFRKFKAKHEFLSSEIKGITDKEAASSYSTLLLNRLMFIYFLQKKEFLNDDPNYLRNCLAKIQQQKGKDRFYSFYRDYLLELFFNKLDNPEGRIADEVINEIAGDIPYVNGGVFSESAVEKANHIEIADGVFEEIFAFFDSYTWHLDTRPTGTANEINPEVIGYIFEQYINYTADGKKENGAYYTKQDVTGYIASSVILPGILEIASKVGMEPLSHLRENPDLVIPSDMLHGWSEEIDAWEAIEPRLVEIWSGDPSNWDELDSAPTSQTACLPEENWVEVFYRRERVNNLRMKISSGEISQINQIITENLDAQALIRHVVSNAKSAQQLEALWQLLSEFSVLDPTCGSGAFLFTALEILEEVYSAILESLHELNPESKLLLSASGHPNLRYFIRKHVSLNNLYGTDIMADAIETAKLRIFLSLVSCLDEKSQLEPLPDLDFNLRCGNLLVGFTSEKHASDIESGQLLSYGAEEFKQLVSSKAALQREFVTYSTSNDSKLSDVRRSLDKVTGELRAHADLMYSNFVGMTSSDFSLWASEMKPLHWEVEFSEVMARGGFDAIIGNPPYIQKSQIPNLLLASLLGYKVNVFTDLFEVCYERSLGLLSPSGRHGMIVMSSLARGDKCQGLRQLISELGMSEWWSTYSIRPASLFTGIKVRNTILIIGPGSGTFTTSNKVFSAESRQWLFSTLEYAPTSRSPKDGPVRGGVVQALAEKLMTHELVLDKTRSQEIFFRRSGKYWMPVLLGPPRFFRSFPGDTGEADLVAESSSLGRGEPQSLAIAVSGSKLGYLNWALLGDDFNVSGKQTVNARKFAMLAHSRDESLEQLAASIVGKATSQVILSEYNGALYLNVLWNKLSKETDLLVKVILDASLSNADERRLHIWFRQTVRMTRDDSHRIALATDFVTKELGWHW